MSSLSLFLRFKGHKLCERFFIERSVEKLSSNRRRLFDLVSHTLLTDKIQVGRNASGFNSKTKRLSEWKSF